MGIFAHALGVGRAALLSFVLFLASPIVAGACVLVGGGSFYFTGNSVGLRVDEIKNNEAGVSGALKLELWAFSTGSGPLISYKLAEYAVGLLDALVSKKNFDTGAIPYENPPSGTWQFAILLTERHGTEPIEQQGSAQVGTVIVPQPGLWWSKDEPGRGYTLDYRHGTLIVTTYAYQQGGAPQWYLSAGTLNGAAFAATLDKYTGGQCITCAFAGSGVIAGNDGPIAINFTSATAATATLPGGRVIQIEPFAF